MKLAPWIESCKDRLYHWCPACETLHVIPEKGWTRTGTDDRPTFTPSFGQTTRRGYCHYNITDGQLFFHVDSYHSVRGNVALPDIPPAALRRLNGADYVTSEEVFKR
jgi:hypothetical protein